MTEIREVLDGSARAAIVTGDSEVVLREQIPDASIPHDRSKKRRATWVTVTCATCGATSERPRAWVRTKETFCGLVCMGKARIAGLLPHGHKGTRSRTPEGIARWRAAMTGPKNPAWKGGVYSDSKGLYLQTRYTTAPEHLRCMARKDGAMPLHRLVMAEWVGRPLTRREVVHHVDHDTSHNVRENLELWPDNASHKRWEHGRITDGAACAVGWASDLAAVVSPAAPQRLAPTSAKPTSTTAQLGLFTEASSDTRTR